jgi:thiamine-phosphate pyrophosphorylase
MDARLLAWGRAVKQRRRNKLPVLWLFTDTQRLPDPLPAITRLPQHLCGVVFRHDEAANRAALAKRVAALCRTRQIPLVIAGDARLAAAAGAGIHLRAGRWPGSIRTRRLVTSSAHSLVELRRAEQAGARIIFLSPAFNTASHPNQPYLGAQHWIKIAQRAKTAEVYSLGGVTGKNTLLLARFCTGVGAISALSP